MDSIKNSLKATEVEKFYKLSSGAIWAIRNMENKYQCGGVCIHSRGIIISVALLATDAEMITLEGWCMGLDGFVPLEVVFVDPTRNVAMLCIRDNLSSTSSISYEYLAFSEDSTVISGQKAITLVPSTGDKGGKPIRLYAEGVVAFPSGSQPLAQRAKGKEMDKFYQDQHVHPYRTAERIIYDWNNKGSCEPRGEHPLLRRNGGFMVDIANDQIGEMIRNLNPNLPFIDIMDFPSWSSDVFGCPVLDNSGNIIGLVALAQWSHTYALTVDTLKQFCMENKKIRGLNIVLIDNKMEVS